MAMVMKHTVIAATLAFSTHCWAEYSHYESPELVADVNEHAGYHDYVDCMRKVQSHDWGKADRRRELAMGQCKNAYQHEGSQSQPSTA